MGMGSENYEAKDSIPKWKRSKSRWKMLTKSKAKFEDSLKKMLFLKNIASNFVLIKEIFGDVAGYVGMFYIGKFL